jgi:hypothetical protein
MTGGIPDGVGVAIVADRASDAGPAHPVTVIETRATSDSTLRMHHLDIRVPATRITHGRYGFSFTPIPLQ